MKIEEQALNPQALPALNRSITVLSKILLRFLGSTDWLEVDMLFFLGCNSNSIFRGAYGWPG